MSALLAAQLGGGPLVEDPLYIECPCGAKPSSWPSLLDTRENINHIRQQEKKADEQTKKDEQSAPRMADLCYYLFFLLTKDPLKFVRCRCGNQMDFIPVRLKYRAPCKCDECGDNVPRLSYIYHCPKDRMDEHRTAHRLFDYYDPNKPSPVVVLPLSKTEPTAKTNKKLDEKEDTKETESSKLSSNTENRENLTELAVLDDVAQLDLLKRKLQKRIMQVQKLEEEVKVLREANQQLSKNKVVEVPTTKIKNDQLDEKSIQNDRFVLPLLFSLLTHINIICIDKKYRNPNKSSDLSVLDAILQSELSQLVSIGGNNNVGNNVNQIASELVKLGVRQRAALQWLSNGEIGGDKNGNGTNPDEKVNGIWTHVSLQSLQTVYEKLDVLIQQYHEMSSQVTSLRATCLNHMSKKQDDWENWNADEVVDWISAVENGRFSKYDVHLRQVMNQRSFKGKHMKTLKFDRLTALGINDNNDAGALMNCIQILIKSNNSQ
ncbi:hypothetical protein RFI_12953 [Reticulomyxa filosa]|uniref:SAM domain-containing protein n=1 Tax=Reticulomyxa filosa TaxID=46433 RepID=X6NFT8_RETFI|nr:hypothetical protein RFI_12953 [Reticulomyxa filosa]|eukprot:ETO24207.1 hypothetical protein RFI_12953 [Reticulomyxa filosa]